MTTCGGGLDLYFGTYKGTHKIEKSGGDIALPPSGQRQLLAFGQAMATKMMEQLNLDVSLRFWYGKKSSGIDGYWVETEVRPTATPNIPVYKNFSGYALETRVEPREIRFTVWTGAAKTGGSGIRMLDVNPSNAFQFKYGGTSYQPRLNFALQALDCQGDSGVPQRLYQQRTLSGLLYTIDLRRVS
ncbi:hypothetical protein SAMN05444920_13254 [Nonomuraea solani]|uniref:Uncharacterized protein n=2 Tax=Nonomuraea solani TaxID=1144553 RepID=A0A1H6F1S4_9ACTN|nr:hypothetical protein SAMN05444920_13254 [Nonomuraea solani]